MRKRIAVVMPYHNGMKDYIGRSIQAASNQTDIDVSLYIVDNGSTDGTTQLVNDIIAQEQKNNPNFWIIKIQCPAPGVAYARNVAMEEIISHKKKGNIIDAVAFLDCDDVWDPDHLKHAYNQMEENQVDMVYSDVRCVDEDGNPLTITGIPYFVPFERSNLLNQNFIFISSVLVKPEVIETTGGFDHDADPMGDWDYWLRVSKQYKLYHYTATTMTYLWKTKSGSYYQPEKMTVASEYVKKKHYVSWEESTGPYKEYVSGPINSGEYSDVSGWLSDAEGAALQKYAVMPNDDTMSFGNCLEIGSYKGRSSCYIAKVARELTCIDTFLADTSGQNQSTESTYEEFRKNTEEFSKKIRAIVGTSTDMAGLMRDGYFDMIFLDAMHDYDSVFSDLSMYWDKLKKGGYFLFHDYANPDYPGVAKAANELIGPADEVVDSIGIYKKTSLELKRLLITEEVTVPTPEKTDVLASPKGQEKLTEQKITPQETKQKSIVLAPFARQLPDGKENPKNFPLSAWQSLVKMLRKADIYTVQIGVPGEPFVGADEMQLNPTNETLTQLTNDMDFFISVDTFFQHFAAYHGKRGVVIFSKSDPNIFGHSSNVNLLETRNNLRAEQFQLWTQIDYDESAFPTVNSVFEEVMKLIGNS